MKQFDVQAIEIQAQVNSIFEFVSDPCNLPRWAKAFRTADEHSARLESPQGEVDIKLRTSVCREAHSVDWELEFPDGSIALAQSRVTTTTRDTSIYSFVLHAPPVPLEELEGVLAEQIETLRQELVTLKAVIERK